MRQGSVADLTGSRSTLRVAAPDHAALGRALLAAGLDAQRDGEAYVMSGAAAERVGAIAHAAGIALSELAMQEPTLEDAFLEMTEGAQR